MKNYEIDLNYKPVDLSIWCSVVRNKRKKKGFDNVSTFTMYILFLTRTYINPHSYYKIEQGKQEPSLSQFFAINLVLFDDFIPPRDILELCMSDELKTVEANIRNHNDKRFLVPDEWLKQNTYFLNKRIEDSEQEKNTEASPKLKEKFAKLFKGLIIGVS